MLHGADLLQKTQRVELDRDGAQPILHLVGDGGGGQELRVGRFGRMIGLADLGASQLLLPVVLPQLKMLPVCDLVVLAF